MRHAAFAAILLLIPTLAHAAEGVLYLSPERGFYGVGDVFEVQVYADTDGEYMNAAEAEITFDPNELFVEDVSIEGSILSLWPTPPSFSNETGTIRFSGWASTRYQGGDGLLATIIFRSLRLTLSSVRLSSGALLSSDDRGSNIVTSMRSAAYTITPRIELAEIPLPDEEGVVAGSSTAASIDPDPPMTPDLIEYPYGTVAVGERIVVKGTAEPNSTVLVWLTRGDEPKQLTKVTSAADGLFTFVSDRGLEEGVYRLWAQSAEASGRQSEPSKRIRFEVRHERSLAAMLSAASVAAAFIPLFVLVLIAGLGIAYVAHRRRMESLHPHL